MILLVGNTLEKVCTVKVILVFCFLFLSLFLLFLSPSNRPILILHYFFSQFFPFLFFLRSKIISILSFTAITFVVCPSLLPYLLILIYYWFTLWFFSISFSFALISPFDFLFFFSLPHLVIPCFAVSSCPLLSTWDSSHSWSVL